MENTTRVMLFRDVPEEQRFSIERYADELASAIRDEPGLEVSSVTTHQSTTLSGAGIHGVARYSARFVQYPIKAAFTRSDVHHIVDGSYGDLLRVIPGQRTIVTCHDLMLLRAEEGATGFVGRAHSVRRFRWSVQQLHRARFIVCPSEATRADVIRLLRLDERSVVVIPHGVRSEFRPLPGRTPRASSSASYMLLHVSTGQPYKNDVGVLRVLAELVRRGADVTLLRAGRALKDAGRDEATRLGIADRVHDLGRVSDARLVELYNEADVFLFPSFYEGFGWPVLEAMACGCPVVASDRASLPLLVGRGGLVAKPDDIRALADAVEALRPGSENAAKARAGALREASGYTWERARSAYVELYRTVATEHARLRGGAPNDRRSRQARRGTPGTGR